MVWSQGRPLRINALLKSIYTDLRHLASFSSPYTLFRATKQKNPNILYKDVESWLETQPVYTCTIPVPIIVLYLYVMSIVPSFTPRVQHLGHSTVTTHWKWLHFIRLNQ